MHEPPHLCRISTTSSSTGGLNGTTAQAVALMLEKHDVCLSMLHGFEFGVWVAGTAAERLALLPATQEHILAQDDRKDRFVAAVRDLSRHSLSP